MVATTVRWLNVQHMSTPTDINENAQPSAHHKASPIPVHWEKEVHDGLLRDEALVTRKHDGSPRRTVDLSPLNRYCKWETHNLESPFHVARRVPAHTWKTVTDAWNGYHLVPLKESDCHLTTFTTPFGLSQQAYDVVTTSYFGHNKVVTSSWPKYDVMDSHELQRLCYDVQMTSI